MTAPELKPCPFCDGRNVGWKWVSTYSTDSSYAFFGCLDCRIGTTEADEENTMHPNDVSAWNTRAPDPDLDAHIGAVLEEAAKVAAEWWQVEYRSIPEGPIADRIRALRPDALQALERVRREARVEGMILAAGYLNTIGRAAAAAAIRALIEKEGKP